MAECHGISFNYWTIFGVFLAVSVVVTSGEICQKVGASSCACSNSKGMIDLSKISAGKQSPRWSKLPSSSDEYFYSYDPCTTFTEASTTLGGCRSVLGCQSQGGVSLPLADPSSFEPTLASYDTDVVQFSYSDVDFTGVERKLNVELHCSNEDARLEVVGEEAPKSMIYKFRLYSVYACYNGVYPRAAGVSFGTVLCIIFFVGLFVYCLGGFLFLTYVRHAQGAERFPNVEFWQDFPHLVRDGTLFVFRGCKTETTYDRI